MRRAGSGRVVPPFELRNVSELAVYAIVGVLGGLLAVLFIKAVKYLRMRVDSLPPDMRYLQPAAAGLIVGFAGLWLPQVLGAGYPAIDSALTAAIRGGCCCSAARKCSSRCCASTRISRAACLLRRCSRAPWLAAASAASRTFTGPSPPARPALTSYLISRKLQPQAFFALVAEEDGLELPSMEEQREAPALRVEDAMSPPGAVLDKGEPVRAAAILARERGTVLVESGDGLWMLVTETELTSAPRDAPLVAAVPLEPLPRVYPDVSLDSALRLLGANRVLPVSSRTRPFTLMGLLSLADIERAYGIVREKGQSRPIRAES